MWLSLADLTWSELGQWALCFWHWRLVGRHIVIEDTEFIYLSSRPQQDCPWVPGGIPQEFWAALSPGLSQLCLSTSP